MIFGLKYNILVGQVSPRPAINRQKSRTPALQFTLKTITGTIILLLILGATLHAHHIRGIPHYSYRDNYPETPVYEVIRSVAQYEIIFTYYNIPGQQALDLAVYIKDTVSGLPYTEPVTFWVFGRHEDPNETHPFTAYRNPTNIYKVGWVYEEEGDYYVRVTFTDSLQEQNVLFDLTVGESRKTWLYLGGSILLVVGFAVVTAVLRKRKVRTGHR